MDERTLDEVAVPGMPVNGRYLGWLLVQPDDWVLGRDGKRYSSLWGETWAVRAKDLLGGLPGGGHANFVLVMGRTNPIVVAGCRAHYVTVCPDRPTVPECLYIEA